MHKTCTKCGEIKLVEEFSKRKALRDGLRSECKACEKKYMKKYHEANSEHLKAKNRAWHKANPEYQATWKKDNIEWVKERSRKYHKANTESRRQDSRKRRALKLGVHHEVYKDIDICERDCWICGICGTKINKRLKYPNPRSKSIDHIIALVNGGADAPVNLQATHLRCNQSKNKNAGGQLRLFA